MVSIVFYCPYLIYLSILNKIKNLIFKEDKEYIYIEVNVLITILGPMV